MIVVRLSGSSEAHSKDLDRMEMKKNVKNASDDVIYVLDGKINYSSCSL